MKPLVLEPSPAALVRPVQRFADVLGQRNAVEGLQRRVRTGDHSTGVILYGPPGVGKRTVSRLYAKAVLCEGASPEDAPCNGCAACKDFEMGSLGYVELDVCDGRGAERARELITIARSQPWTDRRVIAIANADAYEPEAFDVLLKTLEETPSATTFVLLARDLKGIRLAGQSRCVIYRLRPLGPAEAKQQARALFDSHTIVYDERVLDVLVAMSQGLPGCLRCLFQHTAGLGEVTLEEARAIFGLDWVGEMVTYWHTVLVSDDPTSKMLALPRGVQQDEAIRRARALLHHIYLHGLKQSPAWVATHPALLHVDRSTLIPVIEAFQKYAEARGVTPESLWCELVLKCLRL